MRISVKNVSFTREEFYHICYFIKQVYPQSIQIDDELYLPEVPEGGETKFYADIGRTCTEQLYRMTKTLELCNTILEFRGKDRDRSKGFDVQFVNMQPRSAREWYDAMIREQKQKLQCSDANRITGKEFLCPDNGYSVQPVFDPVRQLIWFEICHTVPWSFSDEKNPDKTYNWCLQQGVTFCSSLKEGNKIISRLCGYDTAGFDVASETKDDL